MHCRRGLLTSVPCQTQSCCWVQCCSCTTKQKTSHISCHMCEHLVAETKGTLVSHEEAAHSLLRTIPLWSGATLIAPPVSLALGGLTLTTTLTLSASHSSQSEQTPPFEGRSACVAGDGLGSLQQTQSQTCNLLALRAGDRASPRYKASS